MAKTKISEFSATANSNTDINSINIAEGCAPSNINDAIRELMAELKDFQAGTKGDSFNGPVGTSTAAAGAFTTLSSTGNTTLGDASGDTVTINGTTTFVNVNPTLSAGTANGVLYLNGSKVATSGSALTFDGTNLGIGTSSPAYKLDVAGIGRLTTAVNSNATSLILNNSNSAAGGVGVSIDGYSGNTSNKLAQIIFGGAGATGGNIDFLTSANGSSYVDRMRLDSSGNLGIGTSSPNQKLEVSGNIQVTATNKVIFNDGGGTDCFIGRSGAQTLVLGTASAERMRLDSSGNVGIGTSTPSTKLDIQGGAQANTGILLRLSSQSSGVASKTQYTDGNTYNLTFGSNGTGNFVWSTGEYATTLGTERMRLDSSGNLGIGTTSPSATVHANASGGGSVRASRSSVSGEYIQLDHDGTNGTLRVSGANNLIFSTNSAERARIDSSGNLQLGRTSVIGTNNRLAIQMSGTSASGYTAATNAAFAIDAGTATNSVINLVGGGDLGIFRSNSSNAYDVGISFGDNSTRLLAFTTANTERARITSGGGLWVGTTTRQSTSNHAFIQVTESDWTANFQSNTSTAANALGTLIQYANVSPNSTGSLFLRCNDSVTQRLDIRSNGGIANYSANNVNLSDRREKTNFAPAGEYLSKICAIPVQTFNYIDQNMEQDAGLTLGVVAQDVQAVAPELVMESNWGTEENPKMRLSIYQTDLQYALMKCIQEQQAIIEQLKADVAALKGA